MDASFFHAIRTAAIGKTQDLFIPPFLYSSTRLVLTGHFVVSAIEGTLRFKQGIEQNKAMALTAANLTSLFADKITSIDILVRLVLVAKCIEDVRYRHVILNQAYKFCCHVLYRTYPRSQRPSASFIENRFFSYSTQEWVDLHVIKLYHQTLKVSQCTSVLFIQLIQLLRRYADAYLIYSGHAYSRHLAINELAVSFDHYSDQVQNSYAAICEKICKTAPNFLAFFNSLPDASETKKPLTHVVSFAETTVSLLQDSSKALVESNTQEAKRMIQPLANCNGTIQGIKVDLSQPQANSFAKEASAVAPPWTGRSFTKPSTRSQSSDNLIGSVIESVKFFFSLPPTSIKKSHSYPSTSNREFI